MTLKKYPHSLWPNPELTLRQNLMNKKGTATSGAAINHFPMHLKHEAILLANERGLIGDDFSEAVYWIINNLSDYPRCVSCGLPVKFRSYSEAYMYDRCSTKCSNSDTQVKNSKEEASLKRYGVKYHLSSPEIKEKIIRSNVEKHGVTHNMHRASVFNKNMLAQMRRKAHVLPSGKSVLLMGYEHYVVNWLIQNGTFIEEDFDFDNIPTIKYQSDKERLYHPDLFIPSRNLLIEVKSSYTWKADLLKNIAKLSAARQAGYEVQLIIWNKKAAQPIEIRDF